MIEKAILNRNIVFYLIFVIFIGGIYSYTTLPKQEAPHITAVVAQITTYYPGASQSDVEQLVTEKIEEELMNMDEYDYSYSYSYNSVSVIIVYMKYGVDVDATWDDMRQNLDELEDTLPSEVTSIDINTELSKTAGMIISLTGEDYDYDELGFYGSQITNQLKKIDGISKFEILGEVGKELKITLNGQEMNRLGLSYDSISDLISGHNLEIPSGSIESEDGDIPLRIKGSFSSVEEIGNIIIDVSTDNYSVLKLKDIAEIEFTDEDVSTVYKRNGQDAVLLVGYFEENRNILTIGDEVQSTIETIKTKLPEGLAFEEVVFQPTEVKRSIDDFIVNLLFGVGLVIVVVFVGMGFRNAIIVSFAIPISILTTLLIMPIFNIKIHTISITAFIVALGMLVDNAIVVSDAIQNHIDNGKEKLAACVDGTKEVITSILSSTLTTIAAFSPLILLNSMAGDYIKSLPQVVIISLISSFMFAFLVTPALAYVFFKPRKKKKDRSKRNFMHQILELNLNHKFISVVGGLLIIVLLGSTVSSLNVIFFPKADKTIMYIGITADKNIDVDYTENVTDQLEEILGNEAGITNITTAIGGGLPKFYDTVAVSTAIAENAQLLIDVDLSQTEYGTNTEYGIYLQDIIDAKLIGGEAIVKELESSEPLEAPILIKVIDDDIDTINEVAKEIVVLLKDVEGSKNVRTDYTPKTYEYSLSMDEDILNYYGLMKYDVLNEVSIALYGRDVSTYRESGNEYDIKLISDNTGIEDIENMMIQSSVTGNKHLLKDLGNIDITESRAMIQNYDGEKTLTVLSDIQTGYDSSGIETELKEKMKDLNLGTTSVVFDGENSTIDENFGNLGVTAAFAIFMIFTILYIQFRRFRQSFIIMITLPLSAAGALFGLFIGNQPISFTAMLGIVSLIGIVVNNTIVLMEHINVKRNEGMGSDEAAMNASETRFRPIILSTTTTVIGLLPLVFGSSVLFKPMAVALVSGLIISTFLTLIFTPLIYSIVYREL